MFSDPSTIFWLIIAAVGAVFALGIWYVFVRPVPRQSADGVITQKTFKPASTYWQQPTGNRTNFWTPVGIPIAECYVFSIRLDDRPVEAIFSLNTTAAESFETGQRVSIDFEERGIPLVWKRVYVVEMKPY
jgi:hypothetical protein